MYPTEICWQMGLYTDECICDFCEHKYECGGFSDEDEED